MAKKEKHTMIKRKLMRGRRKKMKTDCHCGGKLKATKLKELYQEDFKPGMPFNLRYECNKCDDVSETYYIEDNLFVDMDNLE